MYSGKASIRGSNEGVGPAIHSPISHRSISRTLSYPSGKFWNEHQDNRYPDSSENVGARRRLFGGPDVGEDSAGSWK